MPKKQITRKFYKFRDRMGVAFKDLPEEVKLARYLRARGITVDRLHLIIQSSFPECDLEKDEVTAIFLLKARYRFYQLPMEESD